MERRVIGIETEFGCLVRDDQVGTPETIVHLVRDHCFYEKWMLSATMRSTRRRSVHPFWMSAATIRLVSGCYSHFLMTLALQMPFRSTTTAWITLAGIHLAVMRTTWSRWRMKNFSGQAYVG